MALLRNIVATASVSLVVLEGSGYISPVYYHVVARLRADLGWTEPMFTAVSGLEFLAWAIGAGVLGALLRSTYWYVWTLTIGVFGTFMAWPQYVVTIGSPSASHQPTNAMYAYAFLPLIGAVVGTTMLFSLRALRRPPNQRLERP
jgi:hypothetical protein